MRIVEHEVGSILGEEEIEAIRRVLASGQSLAWGPERLAFEGEFAEYCGARHAVGLTSCTAALHLSAQLLRLGPDDEVVCTPQSFWATAVALVARGVRIRFADIDPSTLNLDPASVERCLTPRTKAIYLVHHGGNPADLDAIREAAPGIPIVEDCAHAAGTLYEGRRIGDGDLCCFSFHSLKNMTTLGEGGMLTTNNERWAAEADGLRTMAVVGETAPRGTDRIGPYRKPDFGLLDHAAGSWDSDWARMEEVGTHYRMSAVQAAVGRVQLRKLDGLNAARARVAQRYTEGLAGIPGLRPVAVPEGCTSAWHLYTCFLEPEAGVDRNELIRYIQDAHGVQIILRFWPLHLGSALRARGHEFGECPVCEKVWFEQQINLPICPAMEDWEAEGVLEALADGMAKLRGRA